MTATWQVERWLGAPSLFGLALPSAQPTPSQLYAPRGVLLYGDKLVAADTGNHRILIWNQLPDSDHADADLVLGQADFFSEGPGLFHLPTGMAVIEGKLVVADAWHHRLLIWDSWPTRNNQPPDRCLGQTDLSGVTENRGGAVSARGFYWPFGLTYANGWLWVTDTGNRRVLGWQGLPEEDRDADLILGQDDFTSSLENRGRDAANDSFRWPHAAARVGDSLWIADAGNHRLLGWTPPLPDSGAGAIHLLGQKDFSGNGEWPYGKQSAHALRFPYAAAAGPDDRQLAVADTANNRILFFEDPQKTKEAYQVLGQPDFASNGENHWKAVTHETLCWPYGLDWKGDRMAIADSGNNRVVVWKMRKELLCA